MVGHLLSLKGRGLVSLGRPNGLLLGLAHPVGQQLTILLGDPPGLPSRSGRRHRNRGRRDGQNCQEYTPPRAPEGEHDHGHDGGQNCRARGEVEAGGTGAAALLDGGQRCTHPVRICPLDSHVHGIADLATPGANPTGDAIPRPPGQRGAPK